MTVILPVALTFVLIPASSSETLIGAGRSPVSALPANAEASLDPPVITSLNPTEAVAGGVALTLTIDGANFTSTAAAYWDATALKTTYVSATQLTAELPAGLIARAATASVTITTIHGTSYGVTLTVNPQPSIVSLSPVSPSATGGTVKLADRSSNDLSSALPKPSPASNVPGAIPSGSAFSVSPPAPPAAGLSPAAASTGSASAPLPAASTNSASTATSSPSSLASASLATNFVAAISSGAQLSANLTPPTIASLSPTAVTAGAGAFTLTISGANFVQGAGMTVVRWNNTALTTSYVSSTQLTAAVPASLVAGVYSGPYTASVTVVTANGISSGVYFTINPPLPVLTRPLFPAAVPAGYGSFVLTIYGANFTASPTVYWGNTPLATWGQYNNVMATVPASLVATPGTVSVTVATASAGTSAPATFTIQQQSPVIASLSPASAAAGGAAFTLTVNGSNFLSGSYVLFNSTWLYATFISTTQMKVLVPASLIATSGVVSVNVYVYSSSGGSGFYSKATLFPINPSPPFLATISPVSTTAGSAGFMLNITGTAFTPDAVVLWGAISLGTIYLSPSQLTASVPPSLIEFSGSASVTVTSAAGTSALATFTINPAPPSISGLSPALATAGGAGFTLTINGAYFTPATTSKWGSTPLATTYINSTQLAAAVPATLIASPGTATITVTTAVGTSAPATLAIVVNPPLNITTTTLPSATAGAAYAGQINVTGGAPGYAWTVTGLPSSLSYFNTSGGTLTIAGTPASPGPVNFQVSVEDTSGVTAGPAAYTINVAPGPNSANNASLNGSYTCLFQGFFDDDGSRWATLASFQADGQGNLLSGVFDTNSHDIGSASGTMIGSYNIGADNNGFATVDTVLTNGAAGIQSTQWAIALTSAAQPALEFRMVESDDLGALPSYQQGTANCYFANTSAFAAASITGQSFVFGLDGEDNSGNLKATAGLLNASAGSPASGNLDIADGGSAAVQTTPFTATYTAPDPVAGRFTVALNGAGSSTGFAVYIVDANRMFILDNTSDDGEQAGNMRAQRQTSYSGANLAGPFVLSTRGAEFSDGAGTPSGFYANLLVGAGDGSGNIAINQSYSNDDGAYSAGSLNGGPTALVFDPNNPGRATFPSAAGTTYLYLFGNTSAFEMNVNANGSFDTGWLEAQTQTAFTDAALAGSYLSGELPLLNPESDGTVGEYILPGNGTIQGGVNIAGQGDLSWDQPLSTTYAWDATVPGTGTFLVADGPQGAASCAVVTAAKFACIAQTDPAPSIGLMQQ
ncbi:MAG: IPT/TIG domain-containing protein [Terracidiphilus sp.]